MNRLYRVLIMALVTTCSCLAITTSAIAQSPGFSARLEAQGRELRWEQTKLQKQRVDLLVRIEALQREGTRISELARDGKINLEALKRARAQLVSKGEEIGLDGNRYLAAKKSYEERLNDYNDRIRESKRVEPRQIRWGHAR